jgi:hypothetical protein
VVCYIKLCLIFSYALCVRDLVSFAKKWLDDSLGMAWWSIASFCYGGVEFFTLLFGIGFCGDGCTVRGTRGLKNCDDML